MKSADTLDMEPVPRHVAGANRATRVQSAAASARHGWSARQALPESLIISPRGPVTRLRMSRAAKRNALDAAMIAGLERCFRSPPAYTRAIVVHGDGRHFSAGLDLSTIAETTAAAGIHLSRACHRAFEPIEHGQVPVIVVLHGAVIGGGLELAMRPKGSPR